MVLDNNHFEIEGKVPKKLKKTCPSKVNTTHVLYLVYVLPIVRIVTVWVGGGWAEPKKVKQKNIKFILIYSNTWKQSSINSTRENLLYFVNVVAVWNSFLSHTKETITQYKNNKL